MSKAKPYTPKNKPSFNDAKGALLYIFIVPLFLSVVLALFKTNITAFILNSIAFFLFILVLNIAKKGFEEENQYHKSTFTKAPKVPYKTIAGYLLGGATLYTAYIAGGQPFIKSVFLAVIATVGYYLLYGFDPKKDKLENPEKYIEKAKNGMKARLMKTNLKMYVTPLSITSNTLKYDFNELEKLIQTEFEKNKNAR